MSNLSSEQRANPPGRSIVGAVQTPEHYERMISARLAEFPPTIQREALARMVDAAAPDIVQVAAPSSLKSYQRSVAVKGLGKVTQQSVARLYSQRGISPAGVEQSMDNSVILADWAHGRALSAGLPASDAEQARGLADTLRAVAWGAGHADANDGLRIDTEGRAVASKAAIAFAAKGLVQASLASLIRDVEVPTGLDGRFSMDIFYVRDDQRVAKLHTKGLDRENPGRNLLPPSFQNTERELPQSAASIPPVMIQENRPAMTSSDARTFLAVPYQQKDAAKQAGARWDTAERAWFIPPGVAPNAFAQWMPEKASVQIDAGPDARTEFAAALHTAGLRVQGAPLMDGMLHRVPVDGDRGVERSGAYKGHLDGRPAGFIQNFKTGERVTWKATGERAVSAHDRAQLAAEAAQKRHDRAHEREQMYERAAGQADAIWEAAAPVEKSAYLESKGAAAKGLREGRYGQNIMVRAEDGSERKKSIAGMLIVPVHGADGKLSSLQLIQPDGGKMFLPNGRMDTGHFALGDLGKPGPLLIAEGYATAATVHELTGHPVLVAFNASNLGKVAELYRARHPERAIYIAGDSDWEKVPNVGRIKAEEAAAAIGGKALFPLFPDGVKGTDWNDLAKAVGRETAQIWLQCAVRVADRQMEAAKSAAPAIERTPRQRAARETAELER